MKKAILFILLIFAPLALSAQASGPMINFDLDTIDYGEIVKGSDGGRTFTFENTGDAPLEIKGVRSSCGCTIPKKPEAPIAPGEKGEITVRYDTNRVGVFRKTITVNTNVASASIIALKIRGNVLAD
ncbi:MAG: DUF1573 domain-containing protein [Flavobacteriaceae bacterium TMED42]|nr:MAG: hypothetical protein CBE26_02720 [Kiritimatiellaceae bacterium TMED266]RPG64319.1 MAG: DUF1573 domain-containing protein [Flavobacteriaceae bacterium TMED42]|tara:strand:+ start:1063 stop:1443 length:381 start_codon:yes stop_codon:yes gene_type:complete